MIGIIMLTLIALVLSILIVLVEDKFNKESDNDFEKRSFKMLPGYNCGACGFGSCQEMAKHMEKDHTLYKKCRPLKGDKLKEMEMFLVKEKTINND